MIKDRIREDMKAAMRSHEAARLSTIRLLLAAIKQREVDERIEADDAVVMQVIAKMVKQRRDSVQQYRAGGREDLASKEQAEIDVLEAISRSDERRGNRPHHRRSRRRIGRKRHGRDGQSHGPREAPRARSGRHGNGVPSRQGEARFLIPSRLERTAVFFFA